LPSFRKYLVSKTILKVLTRKTEKNSNFKIVVNTCTAVKKNLKKERAGEISFSLETNKDRITMEFQD